MSPERRVRTRLRPRVHQRPCEPLTDAGSLRPVQWYFDNLLPEEAQRTLVARPAGTDPGDAFGLLAYYGGESAGS